MTGQVLKLPKREPITGLPPCVCDGSGYVIVEVDGREVARRCPGCAARPLARSAGHYQSWENWKARRELAEQVEALRAWRGGPSTWACLLHAAKGHSNYGTGKSHVLQATGHEWLARGFQVTYKVAPEWLDRIRASFDDETVQLPPVADFDGLLILDEVGLGKDTAWSVAVLEQTAGFRYRHRLPTLLATNLTLDEIEARYPRLADRLCEGVRIAWAAPSWRRR